MKRYHSKSGYKSGLEDKVAKQIEVAGLPVNYETATIFFEQPAKLRRYKPDFPLPNGIITETKGRLMSDDRLKHRLIKEQYPNLDIRFVFSNSRTKIYTGSKTTYGMWCDQFGFQYADKWIPEEWFREPVNQLSLDALASAQIKPSRRK